MVGLPIPAKIDANINLSEMTPISFASGQSQRYTYIGGGYKVIGKTVYVNLIVKLAFNVSDTGSMINSWIVDLPDPDSDYTFPLLGVCSKKETMSGKTQYSAFCGVFAAIVRDRGISRTTMRIAFDKAVDGTGTDEYYVTILGQYPTK